MSIKQVIEFSAKIARKDFRDLVLVKILIPKKLKWQLTQLLDQMNVTAETLYPGLEGLAKSYNSLLFGYGFEYVE